MSLFGHFRKREEKVDFSTIDTHEKVEEAARKGILHPLYLMPPRFNGEESPANRFLPIQ